MDIGWSLSRGGMACHIHVNPCTLHSNKRHHDNDNCIQFVVCPCERESIQQLTVRGRFRDLKALGLSRRKSPVRTILILLIESGLVFLGSQVSYFGIVLVNVLVISTNFSPFGQTVYLLFRSLGTKLENYGFGTLYFSLAVSVGQTENFQDV